MVLRLSAAIIGLVWWSSVAFAAAALENPAPGAIKSGVGVVSGWVCDAEKLEVSFDGGARLFVPYGSSRPDTAGVCGDTDNGFGLLWNYNELGDGPHTVALYIDDILITQVNFNVTTLGTKFLRGVTGQGAVRLSNGQTVLVQWEETTQGFTIIGTTDDEELLIGDDEEPTDITSTDAETALNQLRGVWRVYYGDPQNGFGELWISLIGISDRKQGSMCSEAILSTPVWGTGSNGSMSAPPAKSTVLSGPQRRAINTLPSMRMPSTTSLGIVASSSFLVHVHPIILWPHPLFYALRRWHLWPVSSLGSMEVTGVRIEQ